MKNSVQKKRDALAEWIDHQLRQKAAETRTGSLELKIQVTFSDGGIRRVRLTDAFSEDMA